MSGDRHSKERKLGRKNMEGPKVCFSHLQENSKVVWYRMVREEKEKVKGTEAQKSQVTLPRSHSKWSEKLKSHILINSVLFQLERS